MKSLSEQIELHATIPNTLAGLRLDQVLAQLFPEYSRVNLKSWIQANQVTVNGKILRPKNKMQGGEKIVIITEIEPQGNWQSQNIPINIIHEDEDILIINKSPGLVVHPGAGNHDGTLVNALLHHHKELINLPRAGIVHRLDKDTSGLLVVAKTLPAYTSLIKQLQNRSIKREYEAIAMGIITAGGTIDAPIGRDLLHRKRMTVIESGKPAITHYRILERFQHHTRLKISLETGRTHQIRVHLAHTYHPLLGDKTYGGRLRLPPDINDDLKTIIREFPRQALHARCLGLTHPATEKYQEWLAPIPEDMQTVIEALRKANLG